MGEIGKVPDLLLYLEGIEQSWDIDVDGISVCITAATRSGAITIAKVLYPLANRIC